PTALNLLAYPGFTDDQRRLDALIALVREAEIKQIQIRNLNCGPALMRDFVADSWGMGMRQMIERLKDQLPGVQIGNYTHSKPC
ncbi:MAG: radical SAM protein, partial [Clostridiales bacterium]